VYTDQLIFASSLPQVNKVGRNPAWNQCYCIAVASWKLDWEMVPGTLMHDANALPSDRAESKRSLAVLLPTIVLQPCHLLACLLNVKNICVGNRPAGRSLAVTQRPLLILCRTCWPLNKQTSSL